MLLCHLSSTRVGIFNPGFDTFSQAQFSVCPPNQLGLMQRLQPHLPCSPSAFVTKPNYPPFILAYYQPHPLQSPTFPVSVPDDLCPSQPFFSHLLHPASAPLSSYVTSFVKSFLAVACMETDMTALNYKLEISAWDGGTHKTSEFT